MPVGPGGIARCATDDLPASPVLGHLIVARYDAGVLGASGTDGTLLQKVAAAVTAPSRTIVTASRSRPT